MELKIGILAELGFGKPAAVDKAHNRCNETEQGSCLPNCKVFVFNFLCDGIVVVSLYVD